jgi:hypothetical protein
MTAHSREQSMPSRSFASTSDRSITSPGSRTPGARCCTCRPTSGPRPVLEAPGSAAERSPRRRVQLPSHRKPASRLKLANGRGCRRAVQTIDLVSVQAHVREFALRVGKRKTTRLLRRSIRAGSAIGVGRRRRTGYGRRPGLRSRLGSRYLCALRVHALQVCGVVLLLYRLLSLLRIGGACGGARTGSACGADSRGVTAADGGTHR